MKKLITDGWNVPINLSGRYVIQVQTLDMVPVTGLSESFNIRGLMR